MKPNNKNAAIIAGIWLIIALAFHLAEVGIIGLTVIVLITALNGIIEEHQIGEAFKEALPFTALLVVFFAIVAMIQEQNLFAGIIGYGLSLGGTHQIGMFYLANGILSAISDNVFVATVYIFADLFTSSHHPPVLWAHGVDGPALYDHDDVSGPAGSLYDP
jgi:NhaB family Na+:H+ antiporter